MKKICTVLVLFLVANLLIIDTQAQSRMRKGPYLIYPGNNTEMMVLWQLDTTINCTIIWGNDTTYQDGTLITTEKDSLVDGHQHIITLTGLIADTKYFYKVTENGIEHKGSFVAAPYDSDNCIVFYAYGDTRSLPAHHDSVLKSLMDVINSANQNQSILIHSGDWNSNEGETYWNSEYFNRSYSNIIDAQANIPINGVRGNHEGIAVTFLKYWPYDSLGNFYYSFDYGPAHFTMVDQYVDYSDTSVQYAWIQSDLAASAKEWKFIVLHEPGYSDLAAHPNNVQVQTYIEPLCIQYNVQAVIAGHNHMYAHCNVNGIHHITTGGGGGPLYSVSGTGTGLLASESTLHFVKFTLCNDICIVEAIRPDGTIADMFEIFPLVPVNQNILSNVGFFPNPATDVLNIDIRKLYSEKVKIEIFSSEGNCVYQQTINYKPEFEIETSKFSKGIYTINISGIGFCESGKIMFE
ncbi:MAG: T9SS type A sorting domain-containing protein [Bacteroidota bacterium]